MYKVKETFEYLVKDQDKFLSAEDALYMVADMPCPLWDGDYSDLPYNELACYNVHNYIKRIKAREYWNEIIKSAHGYAEPGIIFIDNHHNYSPDGVDPQFKGITTNPCGEIFMQAYDAC